MTCRQTKLFLKHHHLTILLQNKLIKEQSAILIQSTIRGYIQKCKYSRLLDKKVEHEKCVAALCREIEESLIGSIKCSEKLWEEDEKRLLGN